MRALISYIIVALAFALTGSVIAATAVSPDD